MTTEFHIKQNDRIPVLEQTLSDDAGPLDLTGASVAFRMRRQGSPSALNLAGGASIFDAAGGVVRFAWGVGDTSTPGLYDAEWVITYAGGSRTVPTSGFVLVVVESALA